MAAGLRVTVASSAVQDPASRLHGVSLLKVPRRGMSRRTAARILARDVPPALVVAPGRVLRLWLGVSRLPPEARARGGGRTRLLALLVGLATVRPDVVHFEWMSSATVYMPLFDIWDCPVVISAHGSIAAHLQEHHRARLPELLRRAAAVHCVCDSLRAEVVALGADPSKVRVIRQGVDPGLFRPQGNGAADHRGAGEPLRILTIGWLRWMKGYEYGLEAIATLVASGVPVRHEIIGVAPAEIADRSGEPERIAHTVADLGLDGHVHLRGRRSSSEIACALRSADVLLHPSVDEGLPVVLLEAMACGVPVVAADCGGVAEAFADGVEGFLVSPRDPAGLAGAMLELWRSPELRARMGAAGRANVLSHFRLERTHGQFLSLYRELAGGPGPRRTLGVRER